MSSTPDAPPVLRLVLPKGSLERATLDLFESAGLPMETRWNSHYCADDAAYWESIYYWSTPQESCADDDDATRSGASH